MKRSEVRKLHAILDNMTQQELKILAAQISRRLQGFVIMQQIEPLPVEDEE